MIKKFKKFLREIFAPRVTVYTSSSSKHVDWKAFDRMFKKMDEVFKEMEKVIK